MLGGWVVTRLSVDLLALSKGTHMNQVDSFFGGLANADMNGARYPFLTPGDYIVEIERCRMIAPRKHPNSIAFIIELTIVQSSNPAHEIGAKRSWYQGTETTDKFAMTQGTIKSLIVAVCALKYDDPATKAAVDTVVGKIGKAIFGPINPLCGHVIALTCTSKPKRDGSPYTVHSPFAAPGVQPKDIMALAAVYDSHPNVNVMNPGPQVTIPPVAVMGRPAAPPVAYQAPPPAAAPPPPTPVWNGTQWVFPPA